MQKPEPGLFLRDVSLRFPDGTLALDGVSFRLAPGERGIVAGPNGAGKTVLARVIAGLLEITTGDLSVDGRPPGFDPEKESAVGLVFQNPEHQIVGQTVWEDTLFGPENLGLPTGEARDRAEEALETMGLSHRRQENPYHLSGGERRRLAIAGVLALRPKILVLDEPFSGLDYPSLRRLLVALASPALSRLPVLIATHEIETFLPRADRLLVLRNGVVLFDGPPRDAVPYFEGWDLRPVRLP
ncbi:MAG: energy-coupling factor ABC transporter ATP-binding protein [Spirochaetota bacterium]